LYSSSENKRDIKSSINAISREQLKRSGRMRKNKALYPNTTGVQYKIVYLPVVFLSYECHNHERQTRIQETLRTASECP
jgi:hypothetical protein